MRENVWLALGVGVLFAVLLSMVFAPSLQCPAEHIGPMDSCAITLEEQFFGE